MSQIWTIDAFAAEPFAGNGAAVVGPVNSWPDDAWMQALAKEMAQSATAFLRAGEDACCFGLRWFSPTRELPICGHGSLAAAHALLNEIGLTAEAVRFETGAGPLIARRAAAGIEMDFPADRAVAIAEPPGLADALGARPLEVWKGRTIVALLESHSAVAELRPDINAAGALVAKLTRGSNFGVVGVAEDGPFDAFTRFFTPAEARQEDHATGSVHCLIGPMLASRLCRNELTFHQACPGRGATIKIHVKDSEVSLSGEAVTMTSGLLRAPISTCVGEHPGV